MNGIVGRRKITARAVINGCGLIMSPLRCFFEFLIRPLLRIARGVVKPALVYAQFREVWMLFFRREGKNLVTTEAFPEFNWRAISAGSCAGAPFKKKKRSMLRNANPKELTAWVRNDMKVLSILVCWGCNSSSTTSSACHSFSDLGWTFGQLKQLFRGREALIPLSALVKESVRLMPGFPRAWILRKLGLQREGQPMVYTSWWLTSSNRFTKVGRGILDCALGRLVLFQWLK